MNREAIKYETEGNDSHKDSFLFPIESTIAVQCKASGPWTHDIVEESNGTDHYGASFIIRVADLDMLDVARKDPMTLAPVERASSMVPRVEEPVSVPP